MTGPVLIFDKSFLQSLNVDEAVLFDNFFLSNITPIFFTETLSNLEKEIKDGCTPEEVVGNIAYKTPEFGKLNAHHQSLLEAELIGAHIIDMEYGKPHIAGGKTYELGGKTGTYYQQSLEEEAFSRWQKGEFLELERNIAKTWRKGLSNLDLSKIYDFFQIFVQEKKPKSIEEVKQAVDRFLDSDSQEDIFRFGLNMIGASPQFIKEIINRWTKKDKPPIKNFAPYFSYIFSVDLFFNISIAADLIGRGRPSHKVDLAYLYYLPFCMVFTSNDKLHSKIAPLFLRDNQTFVYGMELKEDLKKLDTYYDSLPDEIKKRGLFTFAIFPPDETSFLTTRLWDKHMRADWRKNRYIPKPQKDNSASKKIMEEMHKFQKEGKQLSENDYMAGKQSDHIVIKRMVHAKKGKWNRFPPEVVNRRKNKNGKWEDTSKKMENE